MNQQISQESFVQFLDFKKIKDPYTSIHVKSMFTSEIADELLKWIDDSSHYFVEKVEKGFRKADTFDVSPNRIPESLKEAFNSQIIQQVKCKAEELFETSFCDECLLFVQRYREGYGTYVHNDYVSKENRLNKQFFTHRLVVYLNHGWKEADGGLFGIFGSSNPDSLVTSYQPVHNSAVGFAIGQNSFHAVSKVNDGTRYNIQFNFRSTKNKYEEE